MRPPLLTALLLAAPLAGQAPDIRADLDRHRHTLGGISDTLALHRLERAERESDGPDDSIAVGSLRRGFTRLRLAEAGDGWFFQRAARDFDAAAGLRPDWPLAWYGLALAQRGRARWLESDDRNLGSRVGFGPLREALGAARRALAVEPSFPPALALLSETAAALRDTQALREEVGPALTSAWAAGVRTPELALELVRLARTAPDDGAPERLDTLRALLAETAGAGHELVWSGFAAGRPWADSLYFAAARVDDAREVAALRDALRPIAGDSVLEGFDAARGEDRAEWLRRFWTDRARQDLRDPAERLAEHYRRLTVAVTRFALQVNRRFYAPNNAYRSGQSRYDDRGVIWIRHGPPDDRLMTPYFGLPPLETWRYHRADGDLLLHFQAGVYSQAAQSGTLDFGGAIDDYRLVPTLFDWMYRRSPAYDMLLASRCPLLPLYCQYMAWGPYGRRKAVTDEQDLVRASTGIATASDGWERRFAGPLTGTTAAFAVGRSGNRTLVHLAYQLPVSVSDTTLPGAILRAQVHLRIAVLSPAGETVGWLDTTTTAALPPGHPGVLEAFGRVALPVPPGRWNYRVELSVDDSIGRVFPTDSVRVGDFSGSRLALSDLVLGKPGIGAPWVPAAADTAYFTPRGSWARGDTLALYHEIYGLAPGSGYTARISVRRGRRVALTTGWEGLAEGTVTRVARRLSLASLRPGNYLLELELRDPAGRRATSRRSIRITE